MDYLTKEGIMYRDYPAFIKSLKRLKDSYSYVKGYVAPLQKLSANLYFLTENLILLGTLWLAAGYSRHLISLEEFTI